jgi:small GTP-binding protein
MDEMTVFKKKICMIGTPAVGKTSLVRRFVYEIFEDKYLSTIGVKISQKIIPPVETPGGENLQYELLLWDIEGREKLKPAVKSYYMGAAGALLVSDLSRMDTIKLVPDLIEEFRKASPKAEIILAGNKLDLVNMDSDAVKELAKIATKTNLECFLTSAKSGQNVEAAFMKFGALFSLEKK